MKPALLQDWQRSAIVSRNEVRRAIEGLAPLIRDEIWDCLSLLKARGQSVLAIDNNVENLTRIADRHYIIECGRAAAPYGAAPPSSCEQLIAEPELQHRYLGV
jgi:branched-chain amino acid transport system ATP-binding protein